MFTYIKSMSEFFTRNPLFSDAEWKHSLKYSLKWVLKLMKTVELRFLGYLRQEDKFERSMIV